MSTETSVSKDALQADNSLDDILARLTKLEQENKFNQSLVRNILESLKTLSFANLLCSNSPTFKTRLQSISDDNCAFQGNCYINITNQDIFEEVAASCEEDFHQTWFSGSELENCSDGLQKTFADDRLCFTYNMIPATSLYRENVVPAGVDKTKFASKPKWSLEKAYDMADLERTVPFYYKKSGLNTGLHLQVSPIAKPHDGICKSRDSTTPDNSTNGYRLFFHPPGEVPWFKNHLDLTINLNSITEIVLTPKLTTTSEDLRSYLPSSRKCVFDNEVRLSLFNHYSQSNCQLECRVNCSLSMCGCVPFYLPRIHNNIQICGRRKKKCGYAEAVYSAGYYSWAAVINAYVGIARDDLWLKAIQKYGHNWTSFFQLNSQIPTSTKIKIQEEFLRLTTPNCSCDCPPSCTTLVYESNIDSSLRSDGKANSVVYIYFGKDEYTSILRQELTSFSDFVANSGGILGVFCGISFLTVAELLYYLTFRFWGSIKNAWNSDQSSSLDIFENSSESTDEKEINYLQPVASVVGKLYLWPRS